MDKISYEVVEHLAVLSETPKGWRKELNLVSWNNRPPKFDIREWSPDHTKMGKGLTFNNEEIVQLKKALAEIELS
ncbi:YdbC family protein [Alkalibacterium sp. f15]|uniref:YdbC family protein n=1 Tax=Alkalibacterium sp. f15 TaxID=3414029 RepID=UPI003BF8EEB4